MTVEFYSPLPPARTGVADYSAALLAALRHYGSIEISPARCDVALYHLGNNRLHSEIYRRALAHPGVIVLHDAVLHHFLLGELDAQQYEDEFVYNYGEWNRGLARDLYRGRAASGADSRYFSYPMLKRAVETARAIIVHNPAAARAVREHSPPARVVEIPHLFAPPPLASKGEALRFRSRLGFDAGDFAFGVFGFLRESKRLMNILEAFREVHRAHPQTGLLVAGDFASTDLARAAEPLLRAPAVVRLPYLQERDFWLAAQSVDACINLRYPAAGESSGIAVRLMGVGKPVFLTESEESSPIPEDACIRIPAGIAERDSLIHHMLLLTSMNEAARTIGQRGAQHIARCHAVEQTAKQYWDVLCEFST